jgi:hypothetical protein
MPARLEAENAVLRRQLIVMRASAAIGAGNPGTWEAGHQSMRVYGR